MKLIIYLLACVSYQYKYKTLENYLLLLQGGSHLVWKSIARKFRTISEIHTTQMRVRFIGACKRPKYTMKFSEIGHYYEDFHYSEDHNARTCCKVHNILKFMV